MMKTSLIITLLMSVNILMAQSSAGKYLIKNVKVNTEFSDFGTAYYGDSAVIFSSPRKKNRLIKNVWKPNQQAYLDLFIGKITSNGEIINKKKMPGGLNSKFHEAQVVFTKDKKTVFFTRNNYYKKQEKNDSTGILKLQLFKAIVDDAGSWSNVEKLPFNSDQYSTGHPALSPDERQLYFVSDRPESIGKTDIYVVDIKIDGTYGEPMNLGSNINTDKKEMFPFMSKENILYFSSEGYETLGGLDIFASKKYTTTYSKPLNIGESINSQKDDFAFIINNENTSGFFSSNRKQGQGDDDIYGFIIDKPLLIKNTHTIEGLIEDASTNEVISGAKVIVFDSLGKVVETVTTDETGAYTLKVELGASYTMKVEKDNFTSDTSPFAVANDIIDNPTKLSFELTPDIESVLTNVTIDPIYYHLNKWNVSTDIDKVIEVLKKYPQIGVESYSHTDSRAAKVYNIRLSKRRAKAVEAYLTDHGIDQNRIKSQWFGEEKLVNNCSSGVKCSKEEHQLNRRTEFIFFKID